MKLAVFDFDSTLMDGETIDFFASKIGVEEEVSKITELAMQGELDFFESLTKLTSNNIAVALFVWLRSIISANEEKIQNVCTTKKWWYPRRIR